MSSKYTYYSQLKRYENEMERLRGENQLLKIKIQDKEKLIQKQVRAKNKFNKTSRQYKRYQSTINKHGRDLRTYRDKLKSNKDGLSVHKYKTRTPHISPMTRANNRGFEVRHKIEPLIHITDETVDYCDNLIKEKFTLSKARLNNKRSKYTMSITPNTVYKIKIVFSDSVGDFPTSKVVHNINDVKAVLIQMKTRHNPGGEDPDDEYDTYLFAIYFFFFNTKRRVGCNPSGKDKTKVIVHLSSSELIRLFEPRSKDNRCFDACFYHSRYQKTPDKKLIKPANYRQKIKYPLRDKMDPASDIAHKVADFYKFNYKIYDGIVNPNRVVGDSFEKSFKLYHEYDNGYEETLILLKIAGHVYLVKDTTVYKNRCTKCGDFRDLGIETTHKCSQTKLSYYQNKICENDTLVVKPLRKDHKKKWVFWDLETMPCGRGEVHSVYAVGWWDCETERYFVEYGKKSFSKFLKWVGENEGKTYIAFNGAKFDFYFIQNAILNKTNHKPRHINSNGRLLSLCWGGKYVEDIDRWVGESRVWDTALFMPGFSLKSACKAFDTKNKKGDFDHTKMRSWSDVYKYKNEVLPYLRSDVLSLRDLTKKYVETCELDYGASPTQYLTLSSYAENIWKSMLVGVVIEIPDMEKQDFIGKSVMGGRCYPTQKTFKSSLADKINHLWSPIKELIQKADALIDDPDIFELEKVKILETHKNTPKLQKLYLDLKKSEDYIFNGDVNSQYPASMAGCGLMETFYPSGFSTWIDNSEECKKIFDTNKQLGIFHIKYTCPTNLRHPDPRKKILVQKSGKKISCGVEWSLVDGEGVFNTIDIQNMIQHGYNIEFLNKGLVWEGITDQIFKKYVNFVYQLKVDASRTGNEVKRQIAKLMMNSLYGKMLQNPIKSVEQICRNSDDIEKFLLDHVITLWEIVDASDDKPEYIILLGDKIKDHQVSKKPRHLGSFILAYSRRLWYKFLECCDPTMTKHLITYVDTDCAHLFGKYHKILEQNNMIDNDKLGYLSNDCKKDALIYQEKNLAPKTYNYLALDKNGKVWTVMKSKGIMKKKLQQEWYDNETSHKVEWDGLKKINRNISNSDRANGVQHYSIKSQHYERTFYKNEWKGMILKDNQFYPNGYNLN